MKAIITVELDGTSYAVDAEAFVALRAYLDRAAARLGNHPDRRDVLAGLERSIGAQLARSAVGRTAPLGEAEMGAALKAVGKVDGPPIGERIADDESSAVGTRPRRLYRLSEGQKIAGVCTGLAAYADIDVGLVRAIFVLLAVFSGGLAVPGYVLMMFLVPLARTEAEIAEARG